MKKKFVLIYIEDINKFLFFNKFTDSLKEQVLEQIYITNRISIWLRSKLANRKCYLITKKTNNDYLLENNIQNTIEVLSKQLTSIEAKNLYYDAIILINKIFNIYNIEYCFLFNGSNICSLGIQKIAQKHKTKLVFFELSNLKGKVFVDSKGVNSNSFIFENIDLLKNNEVDESKFVEWKLNHFKERRKVVVQQASRKTKITNWLLPIDWFGFWTFVPKNFNLSMIQKFREKLYAPLTKIKYDEFNPDEYKYYFFPFQLDCDTQLLIDAKMTNIQGLQKVFEFAENDNRILAVKFHPAEDNKEFIKEVLRLRKKHNFLIVKNNSYQLVEKADCIITINSTIGLEAKLLEKNVIFLGQSLYSKLSKELIPYYITNYLANIDFFNDEKVDDFELKCVLKRAENKISNE